MSEQKRRNIFSIRIIILQILIIKVSSREVGAEELRSRILVGGNIGYYSLGIVI